MAATGSHPTVRHFLNWTLNQVAQTSALGYLPNEIKMDIIDLVGEEETATPVVISKKVFKIGPPRSGTTPVMSLPTELRRGIFAGSLPDKDSVHYPRCKDEEATNIPSSLQDQRVKPRRNAVSNLMTVSRKFCQEVTELVYEEQCFVIHVHEGFRDGGIEFQDVGRQPLQYQDNIDDGRFLKFGNGDEFGFQRLRKIRIQIKPSQETLIHHTAINTYFMNIALCRLLEKDRSETNRITSITIEFVEPKTATNQAGRSNIQRSEQYWWDPDKQEPRVTSIHNLPDVILVLRAFATLSDCHSARIELPPNVRNHAASATFARSLEAGMMSKAGMVLEDDLEMKIESARYALEDFVNYTLHGKGYHDVPKLKEDEVREDVHSDRGGDDDDDDGSGNDGDDGVQTLIYGQYVNVRKHGRSPNSRDVAGKSRRNQASPYGVPQRQDKQATAYVEDDGVFIAGELDEIEQQQAILDSIKSRKNDDDWNPAGLPRARKSNPFRTGDTSASYGPTNGANRPNTSQRPGMIPLADLVDVNRRIDARLNGRTETLLGETILDARTRLGAHRGSGRRLGSSISSIQRQERQGFNMTDNMTYGRNGGIPSWQTLRNHPPSTPTFNFNPLHATAGIPPTYPPTYRSAWNAASLPSQQPLWSAGMPSVPYTLRPQDFDRTYGSTGVVDLTGDSDNESQTANAAPGQPTSKSGEKSDEEEGEPRS